MVIRADVARHAGVSPAVVSYVLNNTRPVAPETRARVLAAIETLGYRPNAVARSLRTARTHTLGLLIPDSANPFFARLAGAIEDAAFAAGFTVLVGNSVDDPARELKYLQTFIDGRADGIILCPTGDVEHLVEEIRRSGVPTVVTDRSSQLGLVPTVLVDNVGGARMATEHLLGHGCARIGFIGGRADTQPTLGREAGWRQAMAAAGLQPSPNWVAHTEFNGRAGYAAATKLLADAPEIEALFVSSDQQAIGVLRALAEAGRPAPTFPVVGFDGSPIGDLTIPRLTTVAQPVATMAEAIIETLAALIEPPDPPMVETSRVLPVTLVIRESCGCEAP